MKTENVIYQLDYNDLEEVLRKIFKEEINGLKKEFAREPRLIGRSEVATKLGVCQTTVSNYVKLGLLKNHGFGRKMLIYDTDLVNISKKKYSRYDML